jgi:hypothetical protein
MILFLDDWKKYPDAVIHTSTRNKSFLELAYKFKRMGIDNHAFILALHQPELEFVDPFDPNLDEITIGKIVKECKQNPWYYLRECARVPPQGGSPEGLPVVANRGIIALFWCFFTGIIPFSIQPRQTGKSLGADLLVCLLLFIMCRNTTINLLTKDVKLRNNNIRRLKKIRHYLPYYLQSRDPGDSDNTSDLNCVLNENFFNTAVAQADEQSAANIGRGFTSPINLIDEGPFCTRIWDTIPAMLSSGGAAREEARRFGMPFGTIITTTAGKLDDPSGKYMHDILASAMPWTEKLYDAKDAVQLEALVENGMGEDPILSPVVNITFSHRQLGYTDEWLKRKLKETGSRGEEADRDYFNKWTSGSISSPLLPALNDRIRASQEEPSFLEITKENFIIRWYIPKHQIEARMANCKFIAGGDSSDGIGRDSMTLVVLDVETLETVATMNVNLTNIIIYCDFLVRFLSKYENITYIPERRGSGSTIIDMLLVKLPTYGIDPFKRIYNQVLDCPQDYPEEALTLKQDPSRRPTYFYEKTKRLFGYATSGSGKFSRDRLYSDTLQKAAYLCGEKVKDATLINEITGLQTKNNRIDHASGSHDDMVIAWMLAVWFLTSTRNLSSYGIYSSLSDVYEFDPDEPNKIPLSPEERYREMEQVNIRNQINELLEVVKETKNEHIATRLIMQIKALDQKLKDGFSKDTHSVDALLNNVKNERAKRIREAMHSRRRDSIYDYS